jgi:hypothetical protein
MMKKLFLIAMSFAAVLTLPTQGEFFQCPPACAGSPNADVMNGSPNIDAITGGPGNDIIFGGDAFDTLVGEDGNDLIFGGRDWDTLVGGPDNDTILPGPDGNEELQTSTGDAGNDSFIVLVGETANCQQIFGGADFDVLHLIGFGPYVAEYPYGQPEPVAFPSFIVIQDPVAGGHIFVIVGDDPENLERINGLSSPNVTLLDNPAVEIFADQNCTFTD